MMAVQPDRPPRHAKPAFECNVYTVDGAERLDQLCLEKRVPRNVFIGCYLDFLVSGAEGVCEAPLKKVSEILMNPRHEYEETRRSAPAIDEEFYNPASGESKTIKAVPQGNPYSSLLMVRHAYKFLDLEHLDLWNRLKERETGAPENR